MKFTGERYIPCKETMNQPIEREHWQRYHFAQTLFGSTSKVLDIASGEGYGSNYLAQKLSYVIGIDISEESVIYARKKYQRDNLKFLTGDMTKIPIDDCSIDGIVSFETIEHVDEPDQIKFLKESKRILRPEGILVLSCPNKKIASDLAYELWKYKNPYHKKEYYIDSFELLLKMFYKNVKLLYQRTETNLILSSEHPDYLQVIWGEKKTRDDTQNIIAICSDMPIQIDMPNLIILDIDNSYLNSQKAYSNVIKANNENILTISNYQKELAQLQTQTEKIVNQKNTELSYAQNYIGSLETELCKVHEELAGIINRGNSLSTINSQLQEELITIKKENETLKRINAENYKELLLLTSSTTWRATKPLRILADKFKCLLHINKCS